MLMTVYDYLIVVTAYLKTYISVSPITYYDTKSKI